MTAQMSLADAGGWQAIKIKRHSHKVIRHAYEEVLNSCARLALFASGKSANSYAVSERQEELFVDDLVNFAIQARRLIENTAKKHRFRQTEVILVNKHPQKRRLSIINILDMIIHHEFIDVIRTEWKLSILLKRATYEDVTPIYVSSIPPVICIQSDRGKVIIFYLTNFVEVFQNNVLGPIIELCEEQKFYLEEISGE